MHFTDWPEWAKRALLPGDVVAEPKRAEQWTPEQIAQIEAKQSSPLVIRKKPGPKPKVKA